GTRDGQPRAESDDTGDVEALLCLGCRATDLYVVDQLLGEVGQTGEGFLQDLDGEVVGTSVAQRATGRFADGGPPRGDNDCFTNLSHLGFPLSRSFRSFRFASV